MKINEKLNLLLASISYEIQFQMLERLQDFSTNLMKTDIEKIDFIIENNSFCKIVSNKKFSITLC